MGTGCGLLNLLSPSSPVFRSPSAVSSKRVVDEEIPQVGKGLGLGGEEDTSVEVGVGVSLFLLDLFLAPRSCLAGPGPVVEEVGTVVPRGSSPRLI